MSSPPGGFLRAMLLVRYAAAAMAGAAMQHPETLFDVEDLIVEEQLLENALVFEHPFGSKEEMSRTALLEFVGTTTSRDGPGCWLAKLAVAKFVTVSAFFPCLSFVSLDPVASCSRIHGSPCNDIPCRIKICFR